MTTIVLNHSSKVEKPYDKMTIAELAWTIKEDWRKQGNGVNYGAKPYLDAMMTLNSINDNYIAESGRSIVAYFLSNATTWKGEVARAVKKELNKRLK
jgi:hypothetical protein